MSGLVELFSSLGSPRPSAGEGLGVRGIPFQNLILSFGSLHRSRFTLSQIKFGTDGWRGVIGRDFTFANVEVVSAGGCRLHGIAASQLPVRFWWATTAVSWHRCFPAG